MAALSFHCCASGRFMLSSLTAITQYSHLGLSIGTQKCHNTRFFFLKEGKALLSVRIGLKWLCVNGNSVSCLGCCLQSLLHRGVSCLGKRYCQAHLAPNAVETRKVCHLCEFGTIPMSRKSFIVFLKMVPVLPVIPVLAANLSWQRGQPLWRYAHGCMKKL